MRKKSVLKNSFICAVILAMVGTALSQNPVMASSDLSVEAEQEYDAAVNEKLSQLQEQIDGLPALEEYDLLSLEEKDSMDQNVDALKTDYFQYSDEERKAVDASNLYALDIYADTYAFYNSENEYDGQLTIEDVDTQSLSWFALKKLEYDIENLPELKEVVDVSDIEAEILTDEQISVEVGGDQELYISEAELDDLYMEVYDNAQSYYHLDPDQQAQIDESKLRNLTAFFSTGVSLYASASVGSITGYDTYRYSGNLSSNSPKYGYYQIATDKTGGVTKAAFCTDSTASTIGGVGTSLSSEWEITNNVVKTIMYYGYGGPGECVSHDVNGYAETHFAICWAMDGNAANKGLAESAYAKLYTNQSDKTVGSKITAYMATSGVSGTQNLVYMVKTAPKPGYGKVAKRISGTSTQVAGAKYQVYTNAACTTKATDINGNNAVFTTTSDSSYSNQLSFNPGTYYVKETSVPSGSHLILDTKVKTLVIQEGKLSFANDSGKTDGWLYDEMEPKLYVKKCSGNDSLTSGNSCYSLEGAEYGVYASKSAAQSDTNRIAVLSTDKDGNTSSVYVSVGTYYIKELKASTGYKKCNGSIDGADQGIHQISCDKPNQTYSITCKEPPVNDPFNLQLQKMDYLTGEANPVGIATFEGAIFEVDYYTNINGNKNGTPARKWYFMTDKDGYFNCQDKNYVAPASTGYRSDEFYTGLSGNTIVYPLGTYHVYEVRPPKYYQNKGFMRFAEDTSGKKEVTDGLTAIIKQDSAGSDAFIYDGDQRISGHISAANLSIKVFDESRYGTVTILKKGDDGTEKPLSGVRFKIVGLEENDEHEAVTDAQGKIKWENLTPQNYVITEVRTADGYDLLQDNISARLPMEMTAEEIKANGADINQAVYDEAAGAYCFYDLTFTISDTPEFDMPMTGGNNWSQFLVLFIALGLILSGVYFGNKKRLYLYLK